MDQKNIAHDGLHGVVNSWKMAATPLLHKSE
jgi:hypothetical protein